MAKDPYRYFRIEAQELIEGLSAGLLALEKGPDAELVRRLLRQAHTLKGASRVVKRSDIGDLAHAMEDVIEPYRDTGGPVARDSVDRALVLLDRIRAGVASLGSGAAQPAEREAPRLEEPPGAAVDETAPAIRIRVADLDALLEGTEEARIRASVLRRELARVEEARSSAADLADAAAHSAAAPRRLVVLAEAVAEALNRAQRALTSSVDELSAELEELRSGIAEARLVPARTLIADLERIARDAARTLDKDVELVTSGVDTHVDAHVLHLLRAALVQVVRNAVAHGVEDRRTRVEAGKRPAGRIEVSIERRGHRVSFVCTDDGRGLAVDAIRDAAVARGLVDAALAPSMTEHDLFRLLPHAGLSTSAGVTDVSGRGVGLDVVQRVVDDLKGELAIERAEGGGTRVTILVPVSLSALPALSAEVDGSAVLLPLDSVRRTLRVTPNDVTRDAAGEHLVVDGRVLPYLRLGRVLGRRGGAARTQSAVVVEAEGKLAAVAVDRLDGTRTVVVRALPEHVAAEAIVSGAALDDEGRPLLVLAPPALVAAAANRQTVEEEPIPSEALPLLVVDDSLTTRMLEQSILESAGYEVDVAVSAEEALAKARGRRYGLLVVDVEMPGMSGFELIETLRGDSELRDVPAILVTSRADPADKRRGKEAGARAYIVKDEFDQAELLEIVRRLTR